MKVLLTTIVSTFIFTVVASVGVMASPYGSGSYGTCSYGNCSISLSSGGSVTLNVTPAGAKTCTTAKDTVTVSTGSSAGYNLKLLSATSSSAMTGVATTQQLPASSASYSTPSTLDAGSWGFRVDGMGGFGSGPTTAQSNVVNLAQSYAGVPTSNDQAALIRNHTSAATNQTTDVWFGICANNAVAPDTYRATVTYTAITNL